MTYLSTIDTIIIALYIIAMVGIGLYSLKKRENMADYYVGGRRAGIFVLGCLWMSSWIGGATVIGSVDKAYTVGISAFWYCGAMTIGCILFALTSTGLIQKIGAKFNFLTYPELIEQRYGKASRLIATITTFLAYIAFTAGQFLAMAKILNNFLGWDLNTSIWIAAASMVIYTALGGFIAVTITGVAQALLILFTLTFVMVPVVYLQLGDLNILDSKMPEGFFNISTWGWGSILGLTVTIILTFYTSMDSYTRCFASKNPRAAKYGTLLAAVMVAIIGLTTTYLGMAGRTLMPELPAETSVMSALILNYMPIGVKGIILVGLLAAIMSTGAVCLLVASANITQDIYKRFLDKEAKDKKLLFLGTITSIVVGVLAVYLATARNDVIDVLYIAFTLNSASLFIPTLAAFVWKKGNAKTAAWSMALSLSTVLIWYILKDKYQDTTIFKLDPVWPGLFVSAVVFFIGANLFELPTAEKEKLEAFWS